MIEDHRNNEIWQTQISPNQYKYYDIKANNGIIKELFDVDHDEIDILNTTLHLRAQTIKLPSDIHPKTLITTCKLCNKTKCDLEHLTFTCEKTKQEREFLNEALEHLLKENITTFDNNTFKEKITSILSLNATKDKKLNITILKAYSKFIECINY